ncbi:GFA family protein [Cognatishimia sp. SS12]|uniref:GFA family protein n=1 Tax=Cognatishimia sp. SS12 TaxID=2979465 RepID=UPI00232BE64F|nr:GFA family protein [Cognatishimia sp. SS12]MDC0737389.1 GFA family protein [Cognatishimia sp. SS12]
MPSGRCECGAVTFTVTAVRREVTACHCSQCRRTSGHVWASTVAQESALVFQDKSGLRWYQSSGFAQRGFCAECGSSLFYKMKGGGDRLAIAAGCIDPGADLQLTKHIFVKDKAGYYDITCQAEQIQKY